MKLNLSLLVGMALLQGVACGTVALNFNVEFDSGVPSGLSDARGTPTNGMIWGILIDGAGDGFAGSYDITAPLAAGSSYVLSISGSVSNDVLWTSKEKTASTASSTELGGVTKGGTGGFYDIGPVDLSVGGVGGIATGPGIGPGDKFYVVWFSSNLGGVLSDPSFIIPSEGSTSAFGEPFVGIDPNRSAGKSYLGTSGESIGTGIQVNLVPEPSGVLLGLLGVFGLLRRKRN